MCQKTTVVRGLFALLMQIMCFFPPVYVTRENVANEIDVYARWELWSKIHKIWYTCSERPFGGNCVSDFVFTP